MRLFIGMPVPPHPSLRDVTAKIVSSVDVARPVPDGTWHITLRFLGDVDDPAPIAAALRARLSDAWSSPGRIVGLGAFPTRRRATILWAGVVAPGVDAIARRCVDATAHFGDTPDDRPFVPHLTLARLRGPRDVSKLLLEHATDEYGPAPLREVVLFQSIPDRAGPRHIPIERYPLKTQA